MNYTPILKMKQGEHNALLDLTTEQKRIVTPLIQVVHKFYRVQNADKTWTRYETPTDKVLSQAVEKIKMLSNFPKVYFDPRPLFSENNDKTLTAITNCAGLFGSNVVPVLTVSDIENIRYNTNSLSLIKQQGICLRVSKDEVNESFFQNIDELLTRVGIDRESTDIIFDYGVTDDTCLSHFSDEIKNDKDFNKWRSVAFVSGAFRESLMGLDPGTHHHKRSDFSLWKELRITLKDMRQINYGDYAIQSAKYSVPVENSTPSRSVIYTKEDEWEIHKGQSDSARNSEKSRQYFAHARQLTDEHSCYGEDCCKGDERIIELSKNPNGRKGTFSTWVQVGVNHHMALTLRQLSSLS